MGVTLFCQVLGEKKKPCMINYKPSGLSFLKLLPSTVFSIKWFMYWIHSCYTWSNIILKPLIKPVPTTKHTSMYHTCP